MAERAFPNFVMRSGASKDGSRYTAYLSVHPNGPGFPQYFTVYDNRSFRELGVAEAAAEKALGLVLDVEEDGTPVFAEGETGFDDDRPGEEEAEERD
ncbi:hypothetical protein EC912_104233 [Luteibacter rhizovicinus]|uniref:Uncharacterized protein n=1 Tax=Luteibacter rhizovicinus TaxID=242606 RepID=A0A4R3YNY0_9GAMM|nr:hypothetical protein [Luteibacter rhizovicinus]TCV94036.1 hypothetical protein EC912_104233 [Luteibacter rhizovicinus]